MGERSKPSRRHHVVSKFYLKGFANNAGQLRRTLLPGNKSFLMASADATVVKDFYNIDLGNGQAIDAYEQLFSKIESLAAGAMRKLQQGLLLDGDSDERTAAAMWVALQHLRSEGTRNQVSQVRAQMYLVLAGLLGKDGLRKFIEEKEGAPISDKRLEAEWADLTGDTGTQLVPDVAEHMQSIEMLWMRATALLLERHWVLVKFRRKTLLTSDHPVTLIPDEGEGALRGAGWANAGAIALPLSRRSALLMLNEPGAGSLLEGTARVAQFINEGSVLNARNSVFSHPEDDLPQMFAGDWPAPRIHEVGPVAGPFSEDGYTPPHDYVPVEIPGITDNKSNTFRLSDLEWPIPGRVFQWEES